MNPTWHAFLAAHRDALMTHLAEHLLLTASATLAALVIGVALAVAAFRWPPMRAPLLAVVGLLQTVPGIALLVVMMALLHRIGAWPALAALLLYALLPIVDNTLIGLTSLPTTLAEAALGLGLSPWQRLRYVRLPLAMPLILTGLRIAAVQAVGLATLAAFVGAGGLGQFINRGLFLSDTRLILLGAVPAALLALIISGLIGLLQRAANPEIARPRRRAMLGAVMAVLVAMALFIGAWLMPMRAGITVGSKNFTEQLIVAEMVAQQIEQKTGLPVNRRFGLGGSPVIYRALRQGTIDVAVEYSGTALSAILHQPVPLRVADVYPQVRNAYRAFGLRWLPPLGFDNSYVLAVRTNDARLASVATITQLAQLAPGLTAAFDFEFAERQDGYAGLQQRYGLHFKTVRDMHPDLLYDALRKSRADVISAYATDGRLANPAYRTLRDDRHFFPPYEASIVVREPVLAEHPELEQALGELSGRLDTSRMQALNAAVDAGQLTVEQAATQALAGRRSDF